MRSRSKRSCSWIARNPRDPAANALTPGSRGILAIPRQTLLLFDREESSRSRRKRFRSSIARNPLDPAATALASKSLKNFAIPQQEAFAPGSRRINALNKRCCSMQQTLLLLDREKSSRSRSKRFCSWIARIPRDPGANALALRSRGILAIPEQTLLLLNREESSRSRGYQMHSSRFCR